MIDLNEEGRISEVGSYECLDSFAESDDMVETFQTSRENQPQPSEKSEKDKHYSPPTDLPSNSSEEADLTTRRDGDFSTYYVYFRSIGWVQATLFILYTGIRATFALFPRKFQEGHRHRPYFLTDPWLDRNMAQMVGGIQYCRAW